MRFRAVAGRDLGEQDVFRDRLAFQAGCRPQRLAVGREGQGRDPKAAGEARRHQHHRLNGGAARRGARSLEHYLVGGHPGEGRTARCGPLVVVAAGTGRLLHHEDGVPEGVSVTASVLGDREPLDPQTTPDFEPQPRPHARADKERVPVNGRLPTIGRHGRPGGGREGRRKRHDSPLGDPRHGQQCPVRLLRGARCHAGRRRWSPRCADE